MAWASKHVCACAGAGRTVHWTGTAPCAEMRGACACARGCVSLRGSKRLCWCQSGRFARHPASRVRGGLCQCLPPAATTGVSGSIGLADGQSSGTRALNPKGQRGGEQARSFELGAEREAERRRLDGHAAASTLSSLTVCASFDCSCIYFISARYLNSFLIKTPFDCSTNGQGLLLSIRPNGAEAERNRTELNFLRDRPRSGPACLSVIVDIEVRTSPWAVSATAPAHLRSRGMDSTETRPDRAGA